MGLQLGGPEGGDAPRACPSLTLAAQLRAAAVSLSRSTSNVSSLCAQLTLRYLGLPKYSYKTFCGLRKLYPNHSLSLI